ncbi:MAG: hypothetical protein ACRC5C_07285, partial [Bacilli bacterium]
MKRHKEFIRGNRNKGLSFRIVDRVPKSAANLAYVHTNKVNPEDCIEVEDLTIEIEENMKPTIQNEERMLYPKEDGLLETENGISEIGTKKIVLTDEFSVKRNRQDKIKPLYFNQLLKWDVDVRGLNVLVYTTDKEVLLEEAVLFETVIEEERKKLILAEDIFTINVEGHKIEDIDFKIVLVQEKGFIYRAHIYTSKRSENGLTYRVNYPAYDERTNTSLIKEQVLNVMPFYNEVDNEEFSRIYEEYKENPAAVKDTRIYTIKEKGQAYEVYALTDVLIADMRSRTPQNFKHRMEAKLKTKLSDSNKGSLKIGFFLVQNAYGLESISGIGRTVHTSKYRPGYLSLENPHKIKSYYTKDQIEYWHIDLSMPSHELKDFDMICIAGYGKANLMPYQASLNEYVREGGIIWVDNMGLGKNVLNFEVNGENTFISNISFSQTTIEKKEKEVVNDNGYFSRMYDIMKRPNEIGYGETAPNLIFGAGEQAFLWTTLLKHRNGGPAIITKEIDGRGAIIYSNCGISRGIYYKNEVNEMLIQNMLLTHAENKWFVSPWRRDYVYHKNNLFKNEYKLDNEVVYVNTKNDYDDTQIVAKKILDKSCKSYMAPYIDEHFYISSGEYHHVIEGSRPMDVENQDFEAVSIDKDGNVVEEWIASATNAIPGWSCRRMAGRNTTFKHQTTQVSNGRRAISVEVEDEEIGAYAFWHTKPIRLEAGSYILSANYKTTGVQGLETDGAKVGLFTESGEMVAATKAATGTSSWKEEKQTFYVKESGSYMIRAGFIDGNAIGKCYIDEVRLIEENSIKGTPMNDGDYQVVAFATRPMNDSIDITAQGYTEANISRVYEQIPFSYIIRPFIYKLYAWGTDELGNVYGRMERVYGKATEYTKRITKADGMIYLGHLHSLLPTLPGGVDWYDKNKVYYEVKVGSSYEYENQFVNMYVTNTKNGKEVYANEGIVFPHKELFNAEVQPIYVLYAQTNYETIRATKSNFGMQLSYDDKIEIEKPKHLDTKENWYLRIKNGEFKKGELRYKEYKEIHDHASANSIEKIQRRTILSERYAVEDYYDQVFYPMEGYKSSVNEVEYISTRMVRVPNKNLLIESGAVEMEELAIDGEYGSYNMMPNGYDDFET